MNLDILLLASIFYFYGSIPFAFIFTYLLKGQVIYRKGTRNVGVANTFMVAGLPAGFLTVAGEVSKAVFPLVVGNLYYSDDLVISLIFIFSAIIGTNFSVFLKGKGGMGSTILLWTLATLSPYSLLLFFAVSIFAFVATKNSYYTSIIAHLLLPAEIFLIERSTPFTIFGLSTAILFLSKYNRSRDDFKRHNVAEKLKSFMGKRYVIDVGNTSQDLAVNVDGLRFLKKKGFQTPATYICTSSAYNDYVSGKEDLLENLEKEIRTLIDKEKFYHVQYPSTETKVPSAEPLDRYSNVKGSKSIAKAIENMWKSLEENRAHSKLIHDLKFMVIQEMIEPKKHGTAFSRNPINGADEVIVELFSQVRDPLMQDQSTPERWIYKWGIWREKPQSSQADFQLIKKIATQTREIEEKYGKSVSLEWAYDGENPYWLKLDEIPKPKGMNIYSNRLSKERMPGIIKPLIWSINIPLVNSSWKRLFIELVGKDAQKIDVNNMARSFYYRAYFNMGIIGDIFELLGLPRESIELLMGVEAVGNEKPKIRPSIKTIRYLPRMMLSTRDKLMFSKRLEKFLTTQREKYGHLNYRDIEELDGNETLKGIEELFKANQEASYFIIVAQLLMGFYNMILKTQLAKTGVDIESIDFSQVTEKLRDIDPNYHLKLLQDKYEQMPQQSRLELQRLKKKNFQDYVEMEDLKKGFKAFLHRFGHLSDSGNDFSKTQWRENVELVLEMIISPRERNVEKHYRVQIDALHSSPIKRMILKTIYNKAARYREYAERMSFLYSYGYALFRPYFLHLAELLVEKRLIREQDDIFYLTLTEIKHVIKSNHIPEEFMVNLAKRRKEIFQYDDVELPDIVYGDDPPVPIPKKATLNKLRGMPASKGYYEGKIKIIRSVKDFSQIRNEDVLVIPYSDASWNPLFMKANAVISESGGFLSHCAIMAREYNIPAVVSVKGATSLRDGTKVTVNGYTGEILIIE